MSAKYENKKSTRKVWCKWFAGHDVEFYRLDERWRASSWVRRVGEIRGVSKSVFMVADETGSETMFISEKPEEQQVKRRLNLWLSRRYYYRCGWLWALLGTQLHKRRAMRKWGRLRPPHSVLLVRKTLIKDTWATESPEMCQICNPWLANSINFIMHVPIEKTCWIKQWVGRRGTWQ